MNFEQSNPAGVRRRCDSWLAWMWVMFLMEGGNIKIVPTVGLRPIGCVICQHDIVPSQRFQALCGHTFHRSCLAVWMRTYAFCPECSGGRM